MEEIKTGNGNFQLQKGDMIINAYTLDNGDIIVNATEMGKCFGKQPKEFLQNKETAAFIHEMRFRNSIEPVQVSFDDNGNIWFHQKLALKFAAWLSPEIAIWCEVWFKELQKLGPTIVDPEDNWIKVLLKHRQTDTAFDLTDLSFIDCTLKIMTELKNWTS